MSKLMKKLISLFVTMVFAVGMVVVPAAHDMQWWEFHGHGGGCCHEHHERAVASHDRNGFSVDLHQSSNVHDSLVCPVCQLASLSFGVPAVSVVAPLFNRIVGDSSIVLLEQKFTAPRLLPFSCGPPVC